MSVESAGLLVYRCRPDGPEVLLVHPGGPYWRGRERAAWSIPKGLVEPGETLEAAALREFAEETGLRPPAPTGRLPPHRTGAGKTIHCWLACADLDLSGFSSDCVEVPWPRGTGRTVRVREADAARYFDQEGALRCIHKGQRSVIEAAFRQIALSSRGIPRRD